MVNPFHALNRPVRKYHTFTNNGLTASPPDPKRGKQATGRLQIDAVNPAYFHMRLNLLSRLGPTPLPFHFDKPVDLRIFAKGKKCSAEWNRAVTQPPVQPSAPSAHRNEQPTHFASLLACKRVASVYPHAERSGIAHPGYERCPTDFHTRHDFTQSTDIRSTHHPKGRKKIHLRLSSPQIYCPHPRRMGAPEFHPLSGGAQRIPCSAIGKRSKAERMRSDAAM